MRRILSLAAVLLALFVLAVWLINRIGPAAPPLTEDPLLQLNREHVGVTDNAAPLYEAALARHRGPLPVQWLPPHWHAGEPIPSDAFDYLAANAETIALLRKATARTNFWVPLTRDAAGMPDDRKFKSIREVCQLALWKGHVARESHDWRELAECVCVADAIGRHLAQVPTVVPQLLQLSCLSYAQSLVLAPLEWPELTPADRLAYAQCVQPCFDPPRDLAESLNADARETRWMFQHYFTPIRGFEFLVPRARVYGEIEHAYDPYRALLSQPLDRRSDPRHPLRLQIERRPDKAPSLFNLASRMAAVANPRLTRLIDVQIWTLATQRGNRLVLELFIERDRAGRFPSTIDFVRDTDRLDPYTGQSFIYRLTERSFTLYSLGVDHDDDGARHDARFGEPTRDRDYVDGDYVFWPIPE